LGLAIHPNSQVLQEFAEMQTLFEQVHGALHVVQPARVQMLFRIGFAPSAAPTPRRPVASFVRI